MRRPLGTQHRIARAIVVAMIVLRASTSAADPPGSEDAASSLTDCRRAAEGTEEQVAPLSLAIEKAERALAADSNDARAHFALFCALGRQLQSAGLHLSSIPALRRLRAAIDTAHALAPDDPDTLIAKGTSLTQLPSIFGGDRAEGRTLLARATRLAPDHPALRKDERDKQAGSVHR